MKIICPSYGIPHCPFIHVDDRSRGYAVSLGHHCDLQGGLPAIGSSERERSILREAPAFIPVPWDRAIFSETSLLQCKLTPEVQ